MTTVHNVNEALARLRGLPVSTVEAHSRVLRKDGILPETRRGGAATRLQPIHSAYILFSLMRGSPKAASENAREVGGLIVNDVEFEPVLQKQLSTLGWSRSITFAEATAWVIQRIMDNTADEFIDPEHSIKLTVDRYWSSASISWLPSLALTEAYVAGWAEVLKQAEPVFPQRRLDGRLVDPMIIHFSHPLIYQRYESYERGDSAANHEAVTKHMERKKQAEKFDRWGSEWVTRPTLEALAGLFRGGV